MTLWEWGVKAFRVTNVVRELSFPEYGEMFMRAVQRGGNTNLLWHWQACTVQLWLFSDLLQQPKTPKAREKRGRCLCAVLQSFWCWTLNLSHRHVSG
jgi:hypothetical protein